MAKQRRPRIPIPSLHTDGCCRAYSLPRIPFLAGPSAWRVCLTGGQGGVAIAPPAQPSPQLRVAPLIRNGFVAAPAPTPPSLRAAQSLLSLLPTVAPFASSKASSPKTTGVGESGLSWQHGLPLPGSHGALRAGAADRTFSLAADRVNQDCQPVCPAWPGGVPPKASAHPTTNPGPFGGAPAQVRTAAARARVGGCRGAPHGPCAQQTCA